MAKVKPDFIIELRGKQYITYEGLLDLAHHNGLKSITTELISYQGVGKEAVVRAVAVRRSEAEGGESSYTGLGDASPQNVGKGIAMCTLRMAETRAKARALRDFNNVGMCAVEELPPDEPAKTLADPLPRAPVPRAPTSGGPLPRCPDCGSDMWDNRKRRAKDQADPNKKHARPAFKCKQDGDHTPIWESTGWEQKVQQAERQTSQDEMNDLDLRDRYSEPPVADDDSHDHQDPPF
jgi:hypothetical protein